MVFAVLVSADATGLLAPSLTAQPEITAQALQAAPESLQGDSAAGAIEMAAPQAAAENQAVVAEKGLSVAVGKEKESAVAETQAPTLRKAAAPAQTALESAAEASDSALPPPVAAMAAAEVEEVAKAQSVPPPPEAAMAAPAVGEAVKVEAVAPTPEAALAASVDESSEAKTATPPPIAALTTAEQAPEPTTMAQDSPRHVPPVYNPITIWRVLEGVTALAAVAFLVGWLLRRRTDR